MKNLLTMLVVMMALFAGPLLAEERPLGMTEQGLYNYLMGEKAPVTSGEPGLTHEKVVETESAEGETYKTTYLKLSYQGKPVGKARLDDTGVIDELIIESPLVRHEAGYGVGTEWREAARSFPGGELIYTYVSDSLFAQSEYLEGLQLHLDKSDYQGKKPLDGEFQKIPESELKPTAKIKKIRLYR